MSHPTANIAALRGVSGILVTPYDNEGHIAPDRLTPIITRRPIARAASQMALRMPGSRL